MTKEKRYYVGLWLTYLAALIVTAGFLLAYQQKQLPVLEESPVATWLKAKQTEAASHDGAKLPSASLKLLKDSRNRLSGWLEDDQWLAGVNRYLEMAVEPKQATWNAPPAGRSAPVEIVNLQRETLAKSTIKKYQSIEANLISTAPQSESWEYILKLEVQGREREIELPDGHGVIDLLTPGKGQISLQIIQIERKCWLLCEQPFTGVATLPLADLRPDIPKDLALPKPDSAELSGYLVRLTSKASNLERLSGDDSDPAKPEIIKLYGSRITVQEGGVSFNKMDYSDHLLLRRSDRYTAVIIMGDSELRSRVWIESDAVPLQRVGSYSSDAPLLVAVTNAWSSLRLTFRVYEPGDVLQYRILAMSGKRIPGRELILEVIGKYLTELEFDHRPITGPELNAAVEWLVKSLEVHFTDEDVHETDPPQVQALIKNLAEAIGARPSPTDIPKVETDP